MAIKSAPGTGLRIRFQRLVVVDDAGCWLWQGALQQGGYGTFKIQGRGSKRAHRIAYELYRSEIPKGMDLDHLCRVRHCVNPWHLEPVSRAENLRRGQGKNSKTECSHGHGPLTMYGGRRRCRTCTLEGNRR